MTARMHTRTIVFTPISLTKTINNRLGYVHAGTMNSAESTNNIKQSAVDVAAASSSCNCVGSELAASRFVCAARNAADDPQ